MKRYLLALFFCAGTLSAFTQISLQSAIPPAGLIQKSNLWNIAVVNTSANSLDCRLEMILRDRNSGMEVLTATTGRFEAGAGMKQLNASLLMPVQYNYISPSLSSVGDDFLPVGDYIACYRITTGKDILAEECSSFDVEPLSPPMLIYPADSSVLDIQPSQFTWIPPSPANLFKNLRYEVLVTEVMQGQKAEEALQQNLPFYTEPDVPVNNLAYKGMAASFEKGKWYAWQVVAKDGNSYAGKSEVWVFQIGEPSAAQMLAELAPYIKMRNGNPEKGMAPNGLLKLSYINETSDSSAQIVITDLTETDKKGGAFTVALQQGENLITYDAVKKLHLKEGKVYEASLINSRKEKWVMQFEIYKYKKGTAVQQ